MKLYFDKRLKDPTYYAQQGIRNGKKTTTKNVRNFGKRVFDSCSEANTRNPLSQAENSVNFFEFLCCMCCMFVV